MKRTIYDVSPSKDQWSVKRRGAARADSLWDTKPPAIDRGRALAKANEPSQLVIRKADGTIEKEYTYGDDPYPPAG